MKKTIKAFILIFTFMICVSLIGGAYALYVVNAAPLEISFTAEPVIPWAPVVGGYYIIGEHSSWKVNENAILMNVPASSTSGNLAEWTGTIAAGKKFKCIKYNGEGAEFTWYGVAYEGDTPKVDKDYGDGVGGVTASGQDLVAPASGEEIFVCINTDWGINYSWAQTMASKK